MHGEGDAKDVEAEFGVRTSEKEKRGSAFSGRRVVGLKCCRKWCVPQSVCPELSPLSHLLQA